MGSDINASEFARPIAAIHVDPVATTRAYDRMDQYDELRRSADIIWSDWGMGYWTLTRADLQREVLQNPRLFSSRAVMPQLPNPEHLRIPVMIDPPQHTRWRQLLGPSFSPASIERLEPAVLRRCRELVEGIAAKGSCDFYRDFAREFPTTIFMGLIGLPVEDAKQFMIWEDAIINYDPIDDPDQSKMTQAHSDVEEFFRQLLELRRKEPRDDLVTATLGWEIDGRPIPESELLNLLSLLFLAGLDTVTQQLTFSFLHLATHPADRQRIVRDPQLVPAAVEELLRYYAIVHVGRTVTSDVEFHGCPMEEGQIVYFPLVGATRDEAEFEGAAKVDLDRKLNHHMAFGAGPHRCVGSHLARRELCIAFEEWHRQIPTYRLQEGCNVAEMSEHAAGGVIGLDTLPLTWRD